MTIVKELIKGVNCDLNVLGDVKATQWRKDHNMNYAKARHNKDYIAISYSTDNRKAEALKLVPLVNDKKLKWSDIDKEIEAVGGSLALQSWYTFTGLSAKTRDKTDKPTIDDVQQPEGNEERLAMQQRIDELEARLKASEELNALVPVIASEDSKKAIHANIVAEELAKELADIQCYTEQRKQQTTEEINKKMLLVFPNWSDSEFEDVLDYDGLSLIEKKICIDRGYKQEQIDNHKLDVWRSKVESLSIKQRTDAKKIIGVDWYSWEMIKKVYEEITKTKS